MTNIHAVNNGLGSQFLGEIVYKGQDFLIGGTPPDQVDRTGYSTYSYDINDDSIIGPLPIPIAWLAATAIDVSVKYLINEAFATAPSGEVRFQLVYEALSTDATEAIGGGAGATLASADDDIPAVALTPTTLTIGTILAANIAAEDTVSLIFSRIAIAAGNDPTADPELISLHFRFYNRNLATGR